MSNSKLNGLLILILALIFITPWGYMHYSALVLLLPFLFYVKAFDTTTRHSLLLVFFLVTYTLFLGSNSSFSLGAGTYLKYLIVPFLFYRAGIYFIRNNDDRKGIVRPLIYILFAFSFLIFISFAIDIAARGLVSSSRNIQIVGTVSEAGMAATGINANLSVWIVMLALFFYPQIEKSDYKWIVPVLIISVIANLLTIRSATRTGTMQLFIAFFFLILYNFRNYKTKKIVFMAVAMLCALLFIRLAASGSIPLFDNLLSRFTAASDDTQQLGGRVALWKYYGGQILEYPFGGMLYPHEISRFAHNVFLDVARVAGVIPMAALLLFVVLSLIKLVRVLRMDALPAQLKNMLLLLFVAFITSFMVEPIIEGCFNLFALFFFFCGMVCQLAENEPQPTDKQLV